MHSSKTGQYLQKNQQPSQQKNNLLLWSCPNYQDIKCQCNMLWKTFNIKTSTLLGKDKPVSSSIRTLTFLSSHTAKNLQHPNFFLKIKHVGYLIGNVKILIMWQTPKQDYVQFTYSKMAVLSHLNFGKLSVACLHYSDYGLFLYLLKEENDACFCAHNLPQTLFWQSLCWLYFWPENLTTQNQISFCRRY